MEITGKIENISVEKEGDKNNKHWTLSAIIINGEKFKTFNGKNYKVGQSGTFEYTEDQWGKTLIEPKRQSSNNTEVIARLTAIEDLLMELLKRVPQKPNPTVGSISSVSYPPEEIPLDKLEI